MTNLTEFRHYKHPLLKDKFIQIGFSWPAAILGPLWLLFNKLWKFALIIVLCSYCAYQLIEWAATCYVPGDDDWVKASPEIQEICRKRSYIDEINGIVAIIVMFICGKYGNRILEKDLINRGYTLESTINARSLDEAKAILYKTKHE